MPSDTTENAPDPDGKPKAIVLPPLTPEQLAEADRIAALHADFDDAMTRLYAKSREPAR